MEIRGLRSTTMAALRHLIAIAFVLTSGLLVLGISIDRLSKREAALLLLLAAGYGLFIALDRARRIFSHPQRRQVPRYALRWLFTRCFPCRSFSSLNPVPLLRC